MDYIAAIPLIGPLLSFVIPFIVVLGIVVFVHEYGHYIVGRWRGIHAEVFSIGYGKPLKTWHDKRGTKWQIAVLPLGGYVKFLGDANASSFGSDEAMARMSKGDRDRSFPGASVFSRALTVAAGPIFNFILSAAMFTGLILWQGQVREEPTVDEIRVPVAEQYDIKSGDVILAINGEEVSSFGQIAGIVSQTPAADLNLRIRRGEAEQDVLSPYLFPPLVESVQPFSPADRAGLEQGDLITSLADTPLNSFEDLKEVVLASEGKELQMIVLRDGTEVPLTITPRILETPREGGGFERRVMIGVTGSLAITPMTDPVDPLTAVTTGTQRVFTVIDLSLDGMYHILRGVFGAEDGLSPSNLQGPVGIAQLSGKFASEGLIEFIQLIALISTAIGLLNLFPIPILDGGHLVVFAYEAITGRQPHEKVLNFAMTVGLVLLVALMLFATYNDITRI